MTPEELETFAKDVAYAIRGEAPPEGRWNGPTEDDIEMTNECRRIAAMLALLSYRKEK